MRLFRPLLSLLLIVFVIHAPLSSATPPANPDVGGQLDEAAQEATPGGRQVIQTAREMIRKRRVVRGSCWDYANAVFKRAGFGGRGEIEKVFAGPKEGPYADPGLIEPGDWLYLINKPEKLGSHSVIFIGWEDAAQQRALVVSYVGKKRRKPGRYESYDVSRVFQIRRPVE